MIAALLIVALAALGIVLGQTWIIYMVVKRTADVATEERRFLINHVLAATPGEFVQLAAASRPDDTVEAVAEARATTPRAVTVAPLGL